MNRIITLAIALAMPLALVSACDKGSETKTDDKADKAEPAEPAEPEAEAEAKPAEAEPASEVAEVEAGGRVEINVDAAGYHPAEIAAPAKAKISLAFKRTTEAGCGQELVFASLDIKKELPLNEEVVVEVEVPESGELGFACGMNMYKGKVVPKS